MATSSVQENIAIAVPRPRPAGAEASRRLPGDISPPRPEVEPARRVLRFRRAERNLHWALAVPFTICLATALTLVVAYSPAPHRPGREIVSWVHRLSGLCLLVLPILVTIRSRSDWRLYLRNIRQAWTWSRDDLRWLVLAGPAAIDRRICLPEAGKFNAGEKLNFMMVTATWPLFIATGILIWLPGVDIVSWFAHFALAVLVAPLALGHIFMATLNPATRRGLSGMTSGFVDREWARHHYRRWFRENFEAPADRRAAAPPGSGPGISVCCSSCGRAQPPVPWEELVRKTLATDRLLCPGCRLEKRIVLVIGERGSESLIRDLVARDPARPFAGGLPREQVLLAVVADTLRPQNGLARP